MGTKIPPALTVSAGLSSGITIVSATIYTILSSIALGYRNDCNEYEDVPGQVNFMNVIYRVYFLVQDCPASFNPEYVTSSETVFVLVVLTLCMSLISLISAISVIIVLNLKSDVLIAGYIYVAVSVCSLVIDITFGAHFGIDYAEVTNQLGQTSDTQVYYMLDVLRLGSILLMTVALKGFVLHVINIILLIIIVVYLEDYREILKKSEHSIHNMGTLHAYDQPKRDMFELRRDMYNNVFTRASSHVNEGYDDDMPPRRSMREANRDRPDYYNRPYDHTNSFHASELSSGAPFPYMRDPPRAASSPAGGAESHWRRDWGPAPPVVPAPDYSPGPRRLKSAMKPY